MFIPLVVNVWFICRLHFIVQGLRFASVYVKPTQKALLESVGQIKTEGIFILAKLILNIFRFECFP